jgi:hypothetical protein
MINTGTDIDFTKMRKGFKPYDKRRIDICPKCGRKGLRNNHSDGGAGFSHKAKAHVWGGLLIIDHCYIKPEALAAKS